MNENKKVLAPVRSVGSSTEELVRERTIRFVKTHYASTLAEDIKILDQPGGLNILHRKYCKAG